MSGGTYVCSKDDKHRLVHFSSENDLRMPCTSCSGWMMLEEVPEGNGYKKPNIIWLGMAHVIWFFLKPIAEWVDKHDRSDDDD